MEHHDINYPYHIDTCEATALRMLMHPCDDTDYIIFTEKDAQGVTDFMNNIVHKINYPCDIEEKTEKTEKTEKDDMDITDIILTEKDIQDITNIFDNIDYSNIGYITPRDQPTDKEMPKAPRKTYKIYYTKNTV